MMARRHGPSPRTDSTRSKCAGISIRSNALVVNASVFNPSNTVTNVANALIE